jgi:hypothetical protein
MQRGRYFILLLPVAALTLLSTLNRPRVTAGDFAVVAVAPAPRIIQAPVDGALVATFSEPVDPATITPASFAAFGRWSGPAAGEFSFSDGNLTVTLTPDQPFSPGEMVMVTMSAAIQAADGAPLRAAGYAYHFWTAAEPGEPIYDIIDILSVRSDPGEPTRSYGGVATDLNGDGWLDLSIVNEDTFDVRVFLNRADGSGLFEPFLEPPAAVNDRASPSEPADFDGDGHPDLAVANIDANTVSILLGNGDGTFTPQQEVFVGAQPRGIAVLDADGDGDADIVNTNSAGAGTLSLLLNKGDGFFGAPVFFEGGATGEWALAAADMNEDFIVDLVVGAQAAGDPRILVLLGNGKGGFTLAASQSAGGQVWMLNVGDVNGDGHDDVATANSGSNNGAILLGDGAGNLALPMLTPISSFPLATDLGDLDGDGDLDWATSSYGGDWTLFRNDGEGSFSFYRTFQPTIAASCALMLDFDNDGDLDLALIDEEADEVMLAQNNGPPPTATPTATVGTPPATETPTVTPTPVVPNALLLPVVPRAAP